MSDRSSGRVTALAALLLVWVVSCRTIPELPPPPQVDALAPARDGLLAETAARFDTRAPGLSGFELLLENREALLWRLALADHATTSIDVQYFIWQDDEVGRLLLKRLLDAADRGVRVRILVDDVGIAGDDHGVAVLSKHENLEIRIFNPIPSRRGVIRPLLSFAASKQLNRRMHNKLFVVDGVIGIAGGRNIGNPYFGLSKAHNFRDLDVLVTGAVVPYLSDAFDEFWNADVAYPGEALAPGATADELPEMLLTVLGDEERDRVLLDQTPYPVERRDWSERLRAVPERLHAGASSLLQDEPVTHAGEQRRLVDTLDHLAERERSELLIVTPYLIPVGDFLGDLAKLVEEGVAVRILTGSMDSNNHTVAHSHYKKYRRPILELGASLYEFKGQPSEAIRSSVDVPPVRSDFVSLHTKTLVGDRDRCFIGSLNLDPRAIVLNTENGLLIDSTPLCDELASAIDAMALDPENAWRVHLDDGKLRWTSGAETRSSQPARGFGQRVADFFYRLLPIESQL